MLFDERIHYKPFEYPQVLEFTKAISNTYWVHSEVSFDSDLQEYKTQLTHIEKSAIINSLKAISQIEVAVKSYWGNLYKFLPKPEFNGLGASFAESEYRHSEAYSRLLDIIGVDDFEEFCKAPVIRDRINYLGAAKQSQIIDPLSFCRSLAIFSIAIENAALFSQFATILSFQRFRSTLKNVSDMISWTSKDEEVHYNAGIWLINTACIEYEIDKFILRESIRPDIELCAKAEDAIIDFIFEEGELEFLSKSDLKDFFRFRINEACNQLDIKPFFPEKDNPLPWFDEIVYGQTQKDFFIGRPSDYSKHDLAFSDGDLF